jgi:hypothetical protein
MSGGSEAREGGVFGTWGWALRKTCKVAILDIIAIS